MKTWLGVKITQEANSDVSFSSVNAGYDSCSLDSSSQPYLVLFGSGWQASALGVQLCEASRDVLHTGVESAIFIVLAVKVVLVALPLIHRHYRSVFTDKHETKCTQNSVCDAITKYTELNINITCTY